MNFGSVQYELLLPYQLRAIVSTRPIAYVPLGTYEWHCEHLPVGLDALTSHGLCVRAATLSGGVVLPALHYGTGGGHGAYPWTMIEPECTDIESQLHFTVAKLKSFGFQKVILFSGHFPQEQLDMIDQIAARWNEVGFKVIATAVNRIEGLELGPDHAGIFETSLLAAMWPNLVQLSRLPSLAQVALADGEDDFCDVRHNPHHPLYGIFGPDPRNFDTTKAQKLLTDCVKWLVSTASSPETES
jgi:creatinine amidohydrolase